MKKFLALFAGMALVVSAAFFQGSGWAQPAPVASGTAGLDAVRSLDVYVDGSTIDLLLAGPIGKHMAVRYLESSDGGKHWSRPVSVPTDNEPPGSIHRGNDAQIAASGKHLVAVWPTVGGKLDWIGPMASAISSDGGKTWHSGPDPAGNGYKKGQAFIDIAADAAGGFHVVWIDGSTGRQGLRAAGSRDGGKHWSKAKTLDPETCQCCWTALRTGSSGHLYALYRNIAPRDMGLAASSDGGKTWRQRGPVGAFDWQFKACPHTGGGLVVTGGATHPVLHAVVWTGKKGEAGLHYLVSDDGGRRWKLSHRLGGKNARHADLAALDGRRIAAVWDASTPAGDSAIYFSRSEDGGKTWSSPQKLSAPKAEGTHPRIVAVDGVYCVFWTQADGQWKMVRESG